MIVDRMRLVAMDCDFCQWWKGLLIAGRLRNALLFPIIVLVLVPCHSSAPPSSAAGRKYRFFHQEHHDEEAGMMCSACQFPGEGRGDWQIYVFKPVAAPNSCGCSLGRIPLPRKQTCPHAGPPTVSQPPSADYADCVFFGQERPLPAVPFQLGPKCSSLASCRGEELLRFWKFWAYWIVVPSLDRVYLCETVLITR